MPLYAFNKVAFNNISLSIHSKTKDGLCQQPMGLGFSVKMRTQFFLAFWTGRESIKGMSTVFCSFYFPFDPFGSPSVHLI